MSLHIALLGAVVALQGQGLLSDIPGEYISPKPEATKVLVTVNGTQIHASDVERLLWDWRANEVTQDLINYTLIKDAAKKQGTSVDRAEVEAAMKHQLEQVRASLPPEQEVDAALLEQGFTRSRLFLRIEADLLLSKMAAMGFQPMAFVKVSTMIFLPASEQAEAVQAAIVLANATYERLQKGEAWEKVFPEVVSDPEIQRTNGLLGWRSLEAFPASVGKELVALKPGQVTRAAQTPHGIQIFRLEALGRDAKDEELDELRTIFLQSTRQSLMNKLRQEAKIVRGE
jgi:parvulin-like peptidyl-prolyl isomerase